MRRQIALLLGTAAALVSLGQATALPVLGSTPAQVNTGGGQPIVQTGSTNVRVDLNAQRTIIDWTSFNLNPGERADFLFDQRNWMVVNRVTGQAININGQVFAGQAANLNSPTPASASGNVWFYSPLGVAFGPNARVDVGGLLATSAAPNTAAFLNTGSINIPFTGSGAGGPVTVAGGAQFNATAFVALVAPRVDTAAGSTFTVSDYGSVLYGGADSFEIQFFPTSNNDLTIFTFIVPNRDAGTLATQALSIAGQTTSGTIYLAAYSRAAVVSELINAPGLLTARSSIANYGQVTITTGRNILLGQVGQGVADDNQVAGITAGSARIGQVNADGNVNVVLTGGATMGDLTATSIRAGQNLYMAARNVTVPGGLSSGDAGVNAMNMIIDVANQVNLGPLRSARDIQISRGPLQTNRTMAFPTLTLGAVTAGRDVLIQNINTINAGAITAGGQSQIFSGQTPLSITSITTTGYNRLSASAAITLGSARGDDVDIRTSSTMTAGTLTGTTLVRIGVGGAVDVTTITAPTLTIDGATVRVGTVAVTGDALIRTANLDPVTSFTAANLALESPATFRLGGADGDLTNAELGRIRLTGTLSLYAGQRAASINVPNPTYGDFTVLDTAIDPARIPTLALYAHNTRSVLVQGVLAPTASGGALVIGDSAAGSPFLARNIIVTGGLGAAQGDATAGFTNVRAFRTVDLNAGADILMGSARFVDLVDDAPSGSVDLARGLPAGVAAEGGEIGRQYLVAARADLDAGQRILQQNTATAGQGSGFYLTGEGVAPTEPLLTLRRASKIDMFGALPGPDGLVTGQQASFSTRIVVVGGTGGLDGARVNGCPVGVGCALPTPAAEFRIDQFQPARAGPPIDPPMMTPALPSLEDDERETEPVVTGAGNEEIWRKEPQP